MYDRYLSAEFRSEIQTLSKVEHLTLVKFLGHLEHEDERLILLEYVSNGTLREHLDGRSNLLEIKIILLKYVQIENPLRLWNSMKSNIF